MAILLAIVMDRDTLVNIGTSSFLTPPTLLPPHDIEQRSKESRTAEVDDSPNPSGDGNLKCKVLFFRNACTYCGSRRELSSNVFRENNLNFFPSRHRCIPCHFIVYNQVLLSTIPNICVYLPAPTSSLSTSQQMRLRRLPFLCSSDFRCFFSSDLLFEFELLIYCFDTSNNTRHGA